VIFSPSEILPVAESTGFRADVIEKVLHLLNLLNMLNSHPFLKGKLVLKGGSALNLFVFNIPRLSVDIDLNYIGAVGRAGSHYAEPDVALEGCERSQILWYRSMTRLDLTRYSINIKKLFFRSLI